MCPPCPVDCIDMLVAPDVTDEHAQANHARERFNAREKRLAKARAAKKMLRKDSNVEKRKSYVQEAIERSKMKRASVKV